MWKVTSSAVSAMQLLVESQAVTPFSTYHPSPQEENYKAHSSLNFISLCGATVRLWRPGDSFPCLLLFLPLGSQDHVLSIHGKCFYTPNHLAGPKSNFWSWGGVAGEGCFV